MTSRRGVVIGETVSLPRTLAGGSTTVAAPCKGTMGWWVCSTHQIGFVNNLQAMMHDDEPGDHVDYWYCPDHGPESDTPATGD